MIILLDWIILLNQLGLGVFLLLFFVFRFFVLFLTQRNVSEMTNLKLGIFYLK